MSEEFRRKMSEIAKNRKCDSTNDPRNVSVLQYSIIDGSFVSRYRSLSEAARQTGANKLHISECAREIRRQVLDCIWVYESMATEKYIESRLMTARLNKSFNPVVLHNISNNATLYCENMAKASRFLGVGKTTVRTAISLNRECKGYLIKKVSIDEYLNVMKN